MVLGAEAMIRMLRGAGNRYVPTRREGGLAFRLFMEWFSSTIKV